MIIARAEAGKDIRDAEAAGHRHLQLLPKPKIVKKPTLTNDQRMFAKVHGTMSLSCLHAVQKAYKDREKAERTNSKIEQIVNLRDERDTAKHRIKLFHEERRNNILIDRQKERAHTLEVLERRELQQLHYLDKNQEFRNRAKDFKRSLQQDSTFINDFSCQHTSVSNALLRHDRQARVEDTTQEKLDTVEVHRDIELEQKDLVKKYLEHRQLMRQAETAVARASLDTKILQEANEHVMRAHARVAQIRELKKRAKELCPLPSTSKQSIPPDDISRENTQGLDRWNTNIVMSSGRVGKHHTIVIT
jgi:phenylalanyl-tRNA synthetase alpha subunit